MKKELMEKLDPDLILEITQDMEETIQPIKTEISQLKELNRQKDSQLQERDLLILKTEQKMQELSLSYEQLAKSPSVTQAQQILAQAESIKAQAMSYVQSQTMLIEEQRTTIMSEAESIKDEASLKMHFAVMREAELDERESIVKKGENHLQQNNLEVWRRAGRIASRRIAKNQVIFYHLLSEYEKEKDQWLDQHFKMYIFLIGLYYAYSISWVLYSRSFRADVVAAVVGILHAAVSAWHATAVVSDHINIPLSAWLTTTVRILVRMSIMSVSCLAVGKLIGRIIKLIFPIVRNELSLWFLMGLVTLIPLSDPLHALFPVYNTIIFMVILTALYLTLRIYFFYRDD